MTGIPTFSYPPVTHHRLAEGIATVVEPRCYRRRRDPTGGDRE